MPNVFADADGNDVWGGVFGEVFFGEVAEDTSVEPRPGVYRPRAVPQPTEYRPRVVPRSDSRLRNPGEEVN